MSTSKLYREIPTTWSYAKPAMMLHWLLAVLMTVMVALGWYMMSIEKQPGSDWYFNLHKSIGITVLLLVVLRLSWRLRNKPEGLPASVPRWQANLASWTQHLLYLSMIVLPVTGLAGSLFSKNGIIFFGISVPHPAPNHDLSEFLFSIHGVTAWVLVAFATLHFFGGLKHLVIDQDGVFQRMWPKSN